jgi:hypothetical protein
MSDRRVLSLSLSLVGRVGRAAAGVGVNFAHATIPPTRQASLADLLRKGGGEQRAGSAE